MRLSVPITILVLALGAAGAERTLASEAPRSKASTEEEPARGPTAGEEKSPVTIVDHEGGWANLTGVGPGGGDFAERGSFYVISGTLRNDSGHEIPYVRISYELLDDSGKVVFREYGYNRSAEDLRDDAFEKEGRSPAEMGVDPIPESETDTFRMFFFREDLPPFEKYRIRVEPPGSSAPASAGSTTE